MKSEIKFFVLISTIFLFFFALIHTSSPISANMAAPSQGGRMTGEPNGLEKIFIKRETITFDFRQLAAEDLQKKVAVEAIYEIENTGADKPLDLVFVLGTSEVSEFSFFLNDEPIAAEIKRSYEVPKSWGKPEKTKWLDGVEIMYSPVNGYSNDLLKDAFIRLTIPTGNHKLKASYKADPTEYYGSAPMLLYQFAYILAPAKEWAGFGGLDVTVHVPEGWQIVTDPQIEQTSGRLSQHFDKIPADSIRFTLGKSLPKGYYFLQNSFTFLFFLSLFGTPVLILFLAIKKARKENFLHPALGFLWSLIWALLVFGTGFGSIFAADKFYQTISYGYGEIFLLFFLIVLCGITFAVGSIAWAIGAAIWNKKRMKKT